MSKKEDPLEKHLQVREFGDSLYVPLTRFLKKIGIKKDQVVKVTERGEEIVISNPNND